jgi:hypothetical protein
MGQLAAHDLELGAHVIAGDADVDDAEVNAAHGAADGAVEFALGAGDRLDIIRMGETPQGHRIWRDFGITGSANATLNAQL